MAQFTLPANSKVKPGKNHGGAEGATNVKKFSDLSLRPDDGREPAHRHLRRRHGQLRADGSRRADQDQERDRSDADVPPLVPRRHLRLVRDEHRRHELARVLEADRGLQRHRQDLSAAAHAGRQGPRARSHDVLRAVRGRETVARVAHAAAARSRAAAVEGRPGEDQHAVGVHSLRVLLDVVPELLVERRSLLGPAALLQAYRWIVDSRDEIDRRAAGSARGRVPALSLPHDPELHAGVPEGLEPR